MPIGAFLYCGKLDGYRSVSKTLDKTLGGRAGKRFPRGKHLTNPADPRGAGQMSRQPSQARDAEISVGVGDPQSHTTVCGGCESAGWQSQAAKRSSGFPTGKHLTNPADRSRGPVRDRQPSQRCDQNQ